jgi:hypothetical protein
VDSAAEVASFQEEGEDNKDEGDDEDEDEYDDDSDRPEKLSAFLNPCSQSTAGPVG